MAAGKDVDKAVMQAIAAIGRGKRERAQERLSAAWDIVPDKPGPLFRLAQGFDEAGDRDGLCRVAARLAALPAGMAARLAQGRVLRMLDDPLAAVEPLEQAVALSSGAADVHIALSMAYYEAGDMANSVRAGRAGLVEHPGNLLLWLNTLRAEAAIDVERLDLDELDQLIAAGPGRAPAHRFRLNILRRLRLLDRAHMAVDAFARSCPNLCDAVLEHAALDLVGGDPRAAQARLAPVLQEDPPSVERLHKLGQAFGAAGRVEDVEAVLTRLESLPATAERLAVSGRLCLLALDHEAALVAFEASLDKEPDQPMIWALMMEELIQLGRGEEAVARLDAAPEPIRQRPELLVKASNACWATGAPEEGVARLERSDHVAGGFVLRHLTQTLALMGRIDEAQARLAEWTPETRIDKAVQALGQAVIARWNYDFVAMEQYTLKAIGHDPNRSMAYGLLAHARLILCDPSGAMAAQEKMTDLIQSSGQAPRRAREVILWAMAEEMLLDPATTSALAAVSRGAPEGLRDVAAAAVRLGHDQTGPALALLVALRRLGSLEGRPPGPSPIPKVIHQYWEGPPPPDDLARAMEQMRRMNPDCRYVLHGFQGARRYLARHGDARICRAFDLARHAAERADIFRLVLLLNEGGIYIDADDLCRGRIHEILPEGASFVVYQEHYGTIGNNFLATTAGNRILRRALESAVEETLASSAVSLWLRTGPGLITRAIAEAIAEQPDCALSGEIAILRQSDMLKRLIICAPFSYKVDSRHWIKSEVRG